jgi:hypothetical protein
VGCGYNLRGLSSERCPECGLAIDTALSGVIPWERRKGLGYFRSFVRTLGMGTFRPTKLARATGEPIDLRSARIFRWIVRGTIVMPVVGLFELAVAWNGGLNSVFTIESPLPGGPFWEPRFLWTVGVSFGRCCRWGSSSP